MSLTSIFNTAYDVIKRVVTPAYVINLVDDGDDEDCKPRDVTTIDLTTDDDTTDYVTTDDEDCKPTLFTNSVPRDALNPDVTTTNDEDSDDEDCKPMLFTNFKPRDVIYTDDDVTDDEQVCNQSEAEKFLENIFSNSDHVTLIDVTDDASPDASHDASHDAPKKRRISDVIEPAQIRRSKRAVRQPLRYR